MLFFHDYIPEGFDDFLVYKRESFEMPQEKAFSVSIPYYRDGHKRCWKRVWYLSELEIRLMEVEVGELSDETISDMASEQIHKFKKDISHYLNHMNYELIVNNDAIILQERFMQVNSISQLMILMFVAIGGALGACSRYLISELLITILGRGFPYGTLFVNIIGSAMLGGLIGAFERELLTSEPWRLVIGLGYLGAFTTFSTFSMDNVLLLQQGDILKAGLNISLNLLLSIISAYLCFTAVKG